MHSADTSYSPDAADLADPTCSAALAASADSLPPPPRHVEIVDFVRLWPSEGATNPTNSYKLYRSFGVCVCVRTLHALETPEDVHALQTLPPARPRPCRVRRFCVGLSPSGRVGYKLYKLCSFHRCYGLGRACRPYALDNPCTLYELKQLGAHPGPVWTLKTVELAGAVVVESIYSW